MRNVNDFVNTFFERDRKLKDYMEEYKNIEALKLKKKQYDDLINSNEKNDSDDLTFKEKYVIYIIIKNAILNDKDQTYSGIDLYSLKVKFEDLYDDLHEYLSIREKIETLEKRRKKIIHEQITFNRFKHPSEHCIEYHSFVVEDKELKCVYCGATTKDYPLSEEEFEFLVLCAKQQGRLLEEFTKEDWPLLQVIIEQQDYRRSLRPERDPSAYDYFDIAEEQYYENEGEFRELKSTLGKAHVLDAQAYEDSKVIVENPKYLSDKKKKELLENLAIELGEIQKTNSRFKPLLIEQCKTAKYEILILSGEHIPTLLEKAIDEDEKIALTKAYYNLSDLDFRVNSGYFGFSDGNNDAYFYDCYTANPEINSRILEMKLKRN